MRSLMAVFGMFTAFALALGAVSLFGWAAFVGSLVLSDGSTPGEGGALLLILFSFATGSASRWLWIKAHAYRWPEHDPASAFAVTLIVLTYPTFGFAVVWVVLRITGIVGPIITEKGL